jgi:hypothetical protein
MKSYYDYEEDPKREKIKDAIFLFLFIALKWFIVPVITITLLACVVVSILTNNPHMFQTTGIGLACSVYSLIRLFSGE